MKMRKYLDVENGCVELFLNSFSGHFQNYFYLNTEYKMADNPFSDINLPPIKIKNTLKTFVNEQTTIDSLIKHAQQIPNYKELKDNPELLKYVATIVENVTSKKMSVEKRDDVIIKIMIGLFGGEVNTDATKIQITFLRDNKQIHKISVGEKILNFFSSKCIKL